MKTLGIVNVFVTIVLLGLWLAADARGRALTPAQERARQAVLDVWPKAYEQAALAVAWCESRWYRSAKNGQFLGIFQMGAHERRTYGHGTGAYAQARAALRYFRATGSDWSPWSCRWAA